MKISGITVLGAALSLLLKRTNRESAMLCAAAAGILILLAAIRQLTPAVNALKIWAGKMGMENVNIAEILKILSAALVIELSAQLCRELGDDALAQKTLLAGQWLLLGMTIPLLLEIGDHLIRLVPAGA
ncbi:MAG: hypothetical protein IKT57_02680 [Clostridia bacterium]|nr:hypothetical protein [Clostridia bacterium]